MLSKWLLIVGCIFIVLGLLLHFFPGALSWFGRLPGDIRIESERTRVYFPIVSMIVLSILLSLLIGFFRR
ncbi:DUF2905 domain-containing protein [Microbulbifer discodermiae]|uniref:DUF2905 domain-containing protein n=1 Tax=Microbulbifer sp. 2201CG32-9 TaxID=3232309 RepID=UPI00345B726F